MRSFQQKRGWATFWAIFSQTQLVTVYQEKKNVIGHKKLPAILP
jgi:hypothetical protein